MNPYLMTENQVLTLFLVMMRIGSFLVTWPVFGVSSVPGPVKALFSLVVALMLAPLINATGVSGQLGGMGVIWLVMKEVFIGASFGFLARAFFFSMNVCGEIIASSMGLANAQIFNPSMDGRSTVMEQFQVTLATMFFLAIQGHHLFFSGIVDSFRILPLSMTGISFLSFAQMGTFFQSVIEIGVKLSSPVMVAIFFVNVAMGVVGRAVPQINILVSSMPLNIMVGLFVLMATLPLMFWQMNDFLESISIQVFQILRTY